MRTEEEEAGPAASVGSQSKSGFIYFFVILVKEKITENTTMSSNYCLDEQPTANRQWSVCSSLTQSPTPAAQNSFFIYFF